MITVVAGGDSFIWGSELADSPNGGPNGYSRSTFPALLAGENAYVCTAYPGAVNSEIARSVRGACEFGQNHAVIVCWTWPTREHKLDSDDVITELEQYLQKRNIPYLFTCADNYMITGKLDYSNWYLFPPATESWLTTSPRGFYQWAVENKYKCGPKNHPLELAHRHAAQLLQDKYNAMVKKLVQPNSVGDQLPQEAKGIA
jgi:flavodoxin